MNSPISGTNTDDGLRPGCLGLHAVVLRGRGDTRVRTVIAARCPPALASCPFNLAMGDGERPEDRRSPEADQPEKAAAFLGLLPNFNFHIAEGPEVTHLLRLNDIAERRQLTAYDTAYLDLAKRLALPIATLDNDLIKAALAEGVAVL